MPMEPGRRDRVMNLVLSVLLLAAIVEVGLLIRQNRSLRAQLESLATRVTALGQNGGPEVGSKAVPLDVVDLAGAASRLEFDLQAQPTLVLIATAECPACAETLPFWKKALDGAGTGRVRPVALTLEDPIPLQEKLAKAGLSAPVYKVQPGAEADSWRLSLVPLTVLVDTSGKVSKVWSGALSDETSAALAQALR